VEEAEAVEQASLVEPASLAALAYKQHYQKQYLVHYIRKEQAVVQELVVGQQQQELLLV